MTRRGIRVFLDSNVIISGLFSDKGAPRIILDLLCLGLPMLSCITGEYNIIAIERNLTKEMPDVIPVYNEYLPLLNLDVIPLPSPGEIKKIFGLTSGKDIPVLASAILGKVDFLVTGDKKDFIKLRGKHSFKILRPAEFLDVVMPEMLKALGAREES